MSSTAGFRNRVNRRTPVRRCTAGQKIFEIHGLHQLPYRGRHGGAWTLRSGPDPPDEPGHDCFRSGAEYARQSPAVDSKPCGLETGMQDAGDGLERAGNKCRSGLSGDTSVMTGTSDVEWSWNRLPSPGDSRRPS